MNARNDGIDRIERLAEEVMEGAIKLGQDDAIRLAHRVLERLPGMRKKHMFIAGGAALSSAVLIGAAIAIARRVRGGQAAEDAAEEITEDELENLSLLDRRRPRDINDRTAEAAVEDGADPPGQPPPGSPARPAASNG